MERDNELKNTTYEIFIGLLSILSIANILLAYLIPSPNVTAVVLIMDSILTVIFLGDFTYRILTAESKKKYFFHQFGWADLFSSLPVQQLKILRLFRIFRAGRLMRRFGIKGIFKEFVANRANSALLTLLLIVILLLEFGSMFVVGVEQYAPDANITTGGDAIWYTFVTITTVGYGDQYPITSSGRLFGMLIMAIGVGVFGTLTGYLSSVFLSGPTDAPEETEPAAPIVSDAGDSDARSKLAELKKMLAEQQQAQAALADKISEIEAIL